MCLRGRFVEEFYDELERICTDAGESDESSRLNPA